MDGLLRKDSAKARAGVLTAGTNYLLLLEEREWAQENMKERLLTSFLHFLQSPLTVS